jgi:hypothetical protein
MENVSKVGDGRACAEITYPVYLPPDCARTASGNAAAAPPRRAMNSRRLMLDMGLSPPDARWHP